MTAQMCSNFGGFRCSPPLISTSLILPRLEATSRWTTTLRAYNRERKGELAIFVNYFLRVILNV